MKRNHLMKTIATYDLIAHYYAKQVDKHSPVDERNLFLSYLLPNAKILDVGCAAGRDSIFFSQKGFETTGIDLSENLLAIAKQKAPELKFVKGDIREKLFSDNSFDAVWACAVLLHLKREDISAVLANFYSLLAENGLVFIRVKEGVGEADVVEPLSNNLSRHFTYFMLEELQELVENAGFRVEKIFRSNEKDMDSSLRDLWWITVIARKR